MDNNISVNRILHDIENDETYRILWISPKGEYAYWIPLKGKSGMPALINLATIYDNLENERFIYGEEPIQYRAELNEKEKEHRDRIWKLLKEVLLDEPGIYDRKIRKEHLNRIEMDTGIKKTNLYPYLSQYWKCGKISDAFVPSYNKCGGKGKSGQEKQKAWQASTRGISFWKKSG